MRFGIFVAPFGALCEPRLVAELAADAESSGWDGFFVWDHLLYPPPAQGIADPWVTLAAVACATERLVIGPMVTPIARRRPGKLARETVTLDRLSGGRLILGVGLGSERTGEFDRFGDDDDARLRARALDEGLDLLTALWSGKTVNHRGRVFRVDGVAFRPGPVQTPRIPIWVGSKWPNRAPLRRAARWDGWFPVSLSAPDQLAEGVATIAALRPAVGGAGPPFEVAIGTEPGADPAPWAGAGATWLLTRFGADPDADRVRRVIQDGPPGK